MMKTVLYVLRLSLTLLLITALAAASLAYVNSITKDAIAENQLAKTNRAMSEVLPGAENIQKIDEGSGIVQGVYAAGEDSPVQGWAVLVAPNSGFGGEIRMMVGISAKGRLTGISIISHAETPGLGAVAAAKTPAGEAFRSSFFVSRTAVKLSCTEKTVYRLEFQRCRQLYRINTIVFNRVRRAHYVHLFQTGNGTQKLQLHVYG